MKKLIAAAALSSALGIGTTACAHQQLTNQQLARKTVKVAGFAGLIVLMSLAATRPQ